MEQVRDAYGAISERYIGLFDHIGAIDTHDLALIERHLGHLTGPVVDVGCGPGRLTAHLHTLGVDARGIDLTPEFVTHARRVHPHLSFELGPMEQLRFDDSTVAGVLSWYSLIHTPPDRIEAALAEWRRVLRPAGALVLGFFEAEEIRPFEHKVITAYYWPSAELSDRLESAGFEVLDVVHHTADPDRSVRAHATLAARTAPTESAPTRVR